MVNIIICMSLSNTKQKRKNVVNNDDYPLESLVAENEDYTIGESVVNRKSFKFRINKEFPRLLS